MNGNKIVFSEKDSLKYLAGEKWTREGASLISQDSFTLEAISQYLDALSDETRASLRLRVEPRAGDARKLIIDARAARTILPELKENVASPASKTLR